MSTANQNVTPESYKRWDAVGYDWSDPYRGNRIKRIIESKDKFNMEEMIDLQVDYYSMPSEEIIKLASGNISNNIDYFKKLEKWNNILDKNSVEAGIYSEWQSQIYLEFINSYVPNSVKKYLDIQMFRIIETISNMSELDRNEFLNKTFNTSIDNLKNRYGEDSKNWVYGQQNYKHVKISHPLENVLNYLLKY